MPRKKGGYSVETISEYEQLKKSSVLRLSLFKLLREANCTFIEFKKSWDLYVQNYSSFLDNPITDVDKNEYTLFARACLSYIENEKANDVTKKIFSQAAIILMLKTPELDINTSICEGKSNPLMLAAENGSLSLIKLLFENALISNKPLNINYQSLKNGSTPLHIAVLYGHFDVVKYLLEKNANVNIKDEQGYSPLVFALVKAEERIIQMILENPNVNLDQEIVVEQQKQNLLIVASQIEEQEKKIRTIELLLKKGADPFLSMRNGECAYSILSAQQSLIIKKRLSKLFFEYYLDRYKKATKFPSNISSILAAAMIYESKELLEELIDYLSRFKSSKKFYFDANYKLWGRTLLFLAVGTDNIPLTILLLELGADPNKTSKEKNQIPLVIAIQNKNVEMVRLLLPKTSEESINTLYSCEMDEDGKTLMIKSTPLHLAVLSNVFEIVKMVIDKGTRFDIEDSNGFLPIRVAPPVENYDYDTIKIQLFLGAKQAQFKENSKKSDIKDAENIINTFMLGNVKSFEHKTIYDVVSILETDINYLSHIKIHLNNNPRSISQVGILITAANIINPSIADKLVEFLNNFTQSQNLPEPFETEKEVLVTHNRLKKSTKNERIKSEKKAQTDLPFWNPVNVINNRVPVTDWFDNTVTSDHPGIEPIINNQYYYFSKTALSKQGCNTNTLKTLKKIKFDLATAIPIVPGFTNPFFINEKTYELIATFILKLTDEHIIVYKYETNQGILFLGAQHFKGVFNQQAIETLKLSENNPIRIDIHNPFEGLNNNNASEPKI